MIINIVDTYRFESYFIIVDSAVPIKTVFKVFIDSYSSFGNSKVTKMLTAHNIAAEFSTLLKKNGIASTVKEGNGHDETIANCGYFITFDISRLEIRLLNMRNTDNLACGSIEYPDLDEYTYRKLNEYLFEILHDTRLDEYEQV